MFLGFWAFSIKISWKYFWVFLTKMRFNVVLLLLFLGKMVQILSFLFGQNFPQRHEKESFPFYKPKLSCILSIGAKKYTDSPKMCIFVKKVDWDPQYFILRKNEKLWLFEAPNITKIWQNLRLCILINFAIIKK